MKLVLSIVLISFAVAIGYFVWRMSPKIKEVVGESFDQNIDQGEAVGGYGSSAYTIDALNALSSPVEFSQKLAEEMKFSGKEMELFTYDGDDHNLSTGFNTAMQRSVEFFDKHLK